MLLYLKDYLMVYYINALVSEGLGRPYLMECFEEAKTLVDDAYKYSRDEWVCCFKSYSVLTRIEQSPEKNIL